MARNVSKARSTSEGIDTPVLLPADLSHIRQRAEVSLLGMGTTNSSKAELINYWPSQDALHNDLQERGLVLQPMIGATTYTHTVCIRGSEASLLYLSIGDSDGHVNGGDEGPGKCTNHGHFQQLSLHSCVAIHHYDSHSRRHGC